MLDSVGLVLRIVYYYSNILGVNSFEIDFRNGRVFATTWSNLYAITINVIIVILFGFKITEFKSVTIVLSEANSLFQYVVVIVTLLRITTGLAILLNRWRYLSNIMILFINALHLYRTRPQVIRMSRPRIIFKFLNSVLTDIFQLMIAFETTRRAGSASFVGVGLIIWTSAILNLAVAQHFLMMLLVRVQYQLLNTELRQVVDKSRDLSYNPPRRGAFMTRCCLLADQLEEIAKQQCQLQSTVTLLDEVFGVQKVMMYCCYYVSAVAMAYITYGFFKYNAMKKGISLKYIILSSTWCFFFFLDATLNFFMVIQVQDSHKEMILILGERTLFGSDLDTRLEESFESFQLQLIRNPFKVDVLKLFHVDRFLSMAIVGSIIYHSICLIQYDMTTLITMH